MFKVRSFMSISIFLTGSFIEYPMCSTTGMEEITLITDSLFLTSKQRSIVTKKISFWPFTSQRFDDCSNYLSHYSSDLNYWQTRFFWLRPFHCSWASVVYGIGWWQYFRFQNNQGLPLTRHTSAFISINVNRYEEREIFSFWHRLKLF